MSDPVWQKRWREMNFKRLWHTLRLYTFRNSRARTEYIRRQQVYGAIGENCTIQKRKVPLYANLIRLGNNVHIASNVSFLTHDVSHLVLNNMVDIIERGGYRSGLAASRLETMCSSAQAPISCMIRRSETT